MDAEADVAVDAGMDAGADVASDTVAVTTYAVGGTLTGAAGLGGVLQINGGDALTLDAEGAFTFATELEEGTYYEVTLSSVPPYVSCALANDTGTVGTDPVGDITVACEPVFALYPDTGAGWSDGFDVDRWLERARTSAGGMMTVQGTVFSWLPLEAGILVGYRLVEETPFAELVLQTHL